MTDQNFADRLSAAIRAKRTSTCVGIDPLYERLPADISERAGFDDESDNECALDAVREFCRAVIKIVAPLVPVVKINAAFFETYYGPGLEAYFDLVQEARSRGLIVIGDVKRGDVGHSSAAYAQAHLSHPSLRDADELMIPDAITVNPYFGLDGVKPFIDAARRDQKGVFVLVQTSNESAVNIQGAKLADGQTVAQSIARMVHEWSGDDGLIGSCGYSSIGAVVSPRDAASTAVLRSLMPRCFFLVPGFGAQGRDSGDVAPCFNPDGGGAIVTASRSVIYAYEEMKYIELYASEWEKCVERACRDFISAVASATKP
ncbi:MAG: orotidine-5'-phosphate decarboxylase [Phycisphaerales bacterium]|nr:orotidine-5'-phosphate decarboxylase [Phycisphaerales bacterium]